MDFTPVNRGAAQPDAPGQPAPAKYTPARTSPSMGGSSAPIPGADEPVHVRGAPQEPGQTQAPGEGPDDTGTPDELAQRADLSKRLALLARKDRLAREERRKASEERAALKADMEALAAQRAEIEKWRAEDAERRKSPRKVLRDYGFSPEAALQFELSGGKLSPEQEAALRLDETLATERQKTQAELQAIRDEQAQVLAEREEEDAKAEQQALAEQERMAVQEMQADISDIISSSAADFPLLNMSRAGVQAVYGRIEQLSDDALAKTGRRPPITTKLLEQAARQVEADARAELEEANEKLGYRPNLPRGPQTLTNQSLQRRGPAEAPKQETEKERRERVLGLIDRSFGREPRRR